MKNKTKILFIITILTLSLMGCGGKVDFESQLVGTWYFEGEQKVAFILYDDGTCEGSSPGEYGTWSIVNNNQLKFTGYDGESEVGTIVSIENNCLTLAVGKYSIGIYQKAITKLPTKHH